MGYGADMCYDNAFEQHLDEGDDCPKCGIGTLVVSSGGNLYCSEICWKEDETEKFKELFD